jgi:hypothetical protein
VEKNILTWQTKIVIVEPPTLGQKIISDTHGDVLTGHESKNICGQAWTHK